MGGNENISSTIWSAPQSSGRLSGPAAIAGARPARAATLEAAPWGATVMGVEDAAARVRALAPAQSLCWYRGYLPVDRLADPPAPEPANDNEPPAPTPAWRKERSLAVDALATLMLRLASAPTGEGDAGRRPPRARGHLWQRRLGPMHYEYWYTAAAPVGGGDAR